MLQVNKHLHIFTTNNYDKVNLNKAKYSQLASFIIDISKSIKVAVKNNNTVDNVLTIIRRSMDKYSWPSRSSDTTPMNFFYGAIYKNRFIKLYRE